MSINRFVFIGFLFSILFSFFAFMAVSFLKEIKTVTKISTSILTSLVFGFCVTSILFSESYKSEEVWNGGHCPDCGTHWEFEGSAYYKYGNAYYYSCPKCHSVITTNYQY